MLECLFLSMSKHRTQVPQSVKRFVYDRQNGSCACCLERGNGHYHHIVAVHLLPDSRVHNMALNVGLLCERHHLRFHAGDPDTIGQMYEYAYFILFHELPENMDMMDVMQQVVEMIKTKCSMLAFDTDRF